MSFNNSFDNSLLNLRSFINDDLQDMEDFITENSKNCNITLITEIILHLIKAGGKRIRPILVLVICQMFNCRRKDKVYVAAAIEFIHNATLLHDDVIDESNLRRGKNTSNSLWGNKSSILAGDFLLTMAFRWAIDCKNLSVLSVLSQSSYTIVKGEIEQMTKSNNINLSQQNYIDIISSKTASLFAAACESAAIIADTSETEQKALREFGINFGISFQIIDDILDYVSFTNISGKKSGNDFYTGKVTLPVIICYNNANETEKEFWQKKLIRFANKDIKSDHKDSNDLRQALLYIQKHDAIKKSIEIAEYYNNKAKLCIKSLPESVHKHALIDLLNCMTNRQL